MNPGKIFLSILICTRNRARELETCLEPLVIQASEFPDVEVVVVDNGSTDNTREVAARVSSSTGYALRYCFEPVPGLCQARNRARMEALGAVITYIDDDVIIGRDWVKLIREHFSNKKSDCLGGKVSIELGGKMPFKLEPEMHWFFMASQLGEEARFLTYPQHPTGCNMSFTTGVFDEVGGFDTNLKLYGDEKDFFRRVHMKGFNVYYDPAIEVSQYIPAERLTTTELREKSFKWGEGAAMTWMLEGNKGVKRNIKILEYSIRTFYMAVMSKLRGNFGGFYTYWYNRGYLSNLIRGPQQTANG